MLSLFMSQRQIYVRAMMKAIHAACSDTFEYLNAAGTRTDALRAIRTFEKVNGCPFNPHKDYHVNKIRGCSRHEGLFRALKLKLDNSPPKDES